MENLENRGVRHRDFILKLRHDFGFNFIDHPRLFHGEGAEPLGFPESLLTNADDRLAAAPFGRVEDCDSFIEG